MISHNKTLLLVWVILVYQGTIMSMETTGKPLGKKQEKIQWYADKYPMTKIYTDEYQITDQNKISFLRAIEDRNIPQIKRYAPYVNLSQMGRGPWFWIQIMKARSPYKQEYQDIYDLLEVLKEEQRP